MKLIEMLFHHHGAFHWHKAQFSMTCIFTWAIVFIAIYAAVRVGRTIDWSGLGTLLTGLNVSSAAAHVGGVVAGNKEP